VRILPVIIVVIVASLITLGFNYTTKPSVKSHPAKPEAGYPPVVVLELFTSEGCSSCPRADELLPELSKLDSNIIPLSFHVDYWDRLGWKDPYSNHLFTERQEEYAREFSVESIYTPQLVINGKYEVVGSNRSQAELSIRQALADKASVQLKIDDVKRNGDKISFTVKSEGEIKQTETIAVLVQKNATTQVRAGENEGRKLSHTNIVRAYATHTGSKKTDFDLNYPADLSMENTLLIVYVRELSHLHIIGGCYLKM